MVVPAAESMPFDVTMPLAGRITGGAERRTTMSTEENKALIRRAIEEIWNKQNLKVIR